MAKMVEWICKTCQKPFMKTVHRPRSYCSRECYRNSKDFRITSALFMGRGKPGPKKRA
jgi:hypothetical protein